MIRSAAGALAVLVAALPALADEVVLTSGESLQCTIVEQTAQEITVDHPILGHLKIALSDISLINGQDVPVAPEVRSSPGPQPRTTLGPGAPAPALEETPVVEPNDDLPVAPAPDPSVNWKSQIELGFSGSHGSSEDTSLRASFRTERSADDNTLRYDATYRSTTRRGDRTENRLTTGLFSEWREPEARWNVFGQARLDIDEFQRWDERVTVNGGFGYELLRTQREIDGRHVDEFILTTRGGGGVRRDFGIDDESVNPEGLIGGEFDWALSDRQRITGGTTFFPDLEDFSEFRVVSNLDWKITIDEMDGVDLKIGVAHEYESREPADTANDVTAYAALVIRF